MPPERDFEYGAAPRYGHGKPAHPELLALIERRRPAYANRLRGFLPYAPDLLTINVHADRNGTDADPYWGNDQMPGLDAVSLYSLLCTERPEAFVEIGSGHSTRFARRAISTHRLPTKLISIDPEPRARVDSICDIVMRSRLEDADLSVFTRLHSGDFVFFDGSHRAGANSDVSVFFLEVLPRLAAGVWVQVHDVYLPFDYPPEWIDRDYTEQYLLACFLLAGDRLRIELPNAFISQDTPLRGILETLWRTEAMQLIPHHGVSFWMRTRA